jgi:uncharacterized protein (DUF849 family)
VITEIKARCNIVICITTGGAPGMSVKERSAAVPAFKPELASLNFGSLNFAIFPMLKKFSEFKFPWESQYLLSTEDNIFHNTFKTIREFIEIFRENGTKPEIEIYDVGMINNVAFMLQEGHLEKPIYLQFVMGVLGGIPATMENLMYLYKSAKDALGDFVWSACAAGRQQMRLGTAALLMEGNVRVGLEDNLYLQKNRLATSNAEQVEKIVRVAREFDIEPADSDQARQILGLKGLNEVNF